MGCRLGLHATPCCEAARTLVAAYAAAGPPPHPLPPPPLSAACRTQVHRRLPAPRLLCSTAANAGLPCWHSGKARDLERDAELVRREQALRALKAELRCMTRPLNTSPGTCRDRGAAGWLGAEGCRQLGSCDGDWGAERVFPGGLAVARPAPACPCLRRSPHPFPNLPTARLPQMPAWRSTLARVSGRCCTQTRPPPSPQGCGRCR